MKGPPPLYRTWQIPDVAEKLAQQLYEIEACVLRGALSTMRGLVNYSRLITPELWTVLSWPQSKVNSAIAEGCPKREEWFDACIRRLKQALQPPRLSYDIVARKSKKSEFFVCKVANGVTADVRRDQIVYARQWGIEMACRDDASRDQSLASSCITAALARFQSDLESVNRLCTEWTRDAAFLNTVSFTETQVGNRFELLIQGIINEHVPGLATPSTLYADVREWTDMIVARRGGQINIRIQTKFYSSPEDHDEKLVQTRRAAEVVVVSPVELARFLEGNFDPEAFGCKWPEFLKLFPRQIKNGRNLAWELFQLFYAILERPPAHPLDPVHRVPGMLKKAIMAMIENRAALRRKRVEALDRQAAIERSSETAAHN